MVYVANTQGFFILNVTELCHKTFGPLSKLKNISVEKARGRSTEGSEE
jgi:hypothetical protein